MKLKTNGCNKGKHSHVTGFGGSILRGVLSMVNEVGAHK